MTTDPDARQPGQSDAERLADLTSTLGPIHRAAVSVMLDSLNHPPIEWAATTTPKEIAAAEESDVRWRQGNLASLDALLEEMRELRAKVTVDAGTGPIGGQDGGSTASPVPGPPSAANVVDAGLTSHNNSYRHLESEISNLGQGSSDRAEVEPVEKHNSQSSQTVTFGTPPPTLARGSGPPPRKRVHRCACGKDIPLKAQVCADCWARGDGRGSGSDPGWYR